MNFCARQAEAAEIWPSFPGTSVFAQDAWEEVLFLLLRRQEQSLQS